MMMIMTPFDDSIPFHSDSIPWWWWWFIPFHDPFHSDDDDDSILFHSIGDCQWFYAIDDDDSIRWWWWWFDAHYDVDDPILFNFQ